MIAAVLLRLLYLIFQQILGLVLLMGRTSSTKDVELLVLRHEVAVLRRTHPRPRMAWANRAVFAALIRRLPPQGGRAQRVRHARRGHDARPRRLRLHRLVPQYRRLVGSSAAAGDAGRTPVGRWVAARFAPSTARYRARFAAIFAVYASEPSPDEPLKSLTVGERPEPEVADGWVAVEAAAASLNMHDLWTLRGVGIKPDQFPMILGCDGAGRLPDGTEVVLYPVIGDPGLAGDETLDPKRSLLTEKYQGTFADTVVVPARNAVPKPAGLSMTQAAVMGTAWLTAYRMLFVKSGLRPGQTMLVQGASGGVATALVQLGHAAGMQVWATGRTDAKRAVAERLGADATFPSGARLPARVDAVFETVGEATWAHSMKSLKPGGAIVVSGSTSGPNPGADLQRLFFLQLRVIGATMGTRDELADLLAFVANAGITPEIGLELPMEQAEEGFSAMLGGDTTGKIVFTR